ncbi:hypothetical protein [Thermosediminibacter oceani]|uniref:Uncharacterized protein n=1 Tax=Thermosediminibacter oceani (strain ATCC BAA-1034 / DSM 16646 / JW/IW-1228P) TaxID=555079 RepID=D9S3P0_THEOJ|nr:hypothetical protein [Thermosediminibacter oceani]ADL08017.1 hypothetical protein Toce_1261 [Thermosediminibacter oceani DSM 16646]
MFLDIVGMLLTILIVSPVYMGRVFLICLFANFLDILTAMVFNTQVTEVIAGGIFSSINYYGGNILVPYLSPLVLILIGAGLQGRDGIILWDLINPSATYKRPWPFLFLKVGIARILILYFLGK